MGGRYQAYPEYRRSEVEWLDMIPSHWISVPIKYMALEKSSLFLDGDWIESKDISGDEIRYITTGNVGEGVYKEQGTGYISEEKFKQLDCTEVYEGDTLISRLNAPIGRSCVVPNLFSRIVTSIDNVIFRPDSKFFKQFLVHLFSSKDYFKHTSNLARGATMQRISRGLLGNIRVVVPTHEEQEKIANFLDYETAKIDTLIEKQQQLIELLKEKRQAVISHAVTKGLNPDAPMRDSGVEWLGDVPEHWDVCLIKYKCKEITDGAHVSPVTNEGKHYFVSITDIKKGVINFDNALLTSSESYQYLVKTGCMPFAGDILFSKDGTIGQTAITPENIEFVVASSLIIIRPNKNKVTPQYLDFLLKSGVVVEQVESFVKGAALRRLSIQNLLKVGGSFPPIPEQIEICSYLNNVLDKYDELEDKATDLIILQQERRTALISAAVTGKMDVRGWQAPKQNNKEDAA